VGREIPQILVTPVAKFTHHRRPHGFLPNEHLDKPTASPKVTDSKIPAELAAYHSGVWSDQSDKLFVTLFHPNACPYFDASMAQKHRHPTLVLSSTYLVVQK
jgi:hypothetical protein